MKKFNLMIALALFAGSVASFPATASAQANAPAPAQDDKAAQKAEFERNWYDVCYVKKDMEKCYPLSKELLEKYPDSTYKDNGSKIVKNYEQNKAWEAFQAALKAFYAPPQTAAKLETLVTSGTDYYKFVPDEPYVALQLSLASTYSVFGAIQYKNMDSVKTHVDRALKVFETTTPPKDYKAENWTPWRNLIIASGNQFLAYQLVENKGDQDQALAYLAKAIAVRGKDGEGWKDPANYQMRTGIYLQKYETLSKQYGALPDEQKTADAGKELLKQINSLLDTKLIPDYARVLATATKPEYKPYYDQIKPAFDSMWKYRTDAPDKGQGYVDAFKADPTIQGPDIPVKTEDNTALAPAPVGAGSVKPMATGGAAASGAGAGPGGGNGTKATPAKATPAKKKGKRR